MLFSFERLRVCASVKLYPAASVLWEKEANGIGSVCFRKVKSLLVSFIDACGKGETWICQSLL